MIKFMRSAVVVVACLFAGVGAWAAEVHVESGPTYASELFGPGHGSIKEYPENKVPMVTLTIPGTGMTRSPTKRRTAREAPSIVDPLW